MALEVVWMPKAEKRFSEIIEFLTENWSEKEIKFFITQTEHL